MSKYDQDGGFERAPRDLYPTPYSAVLPLKSLLGDAPFSYWEPCCAELQLVNNMDAILPKSKCLYASDLETNSGIKKDVFSITKTDADSLGVNYFITNPPWTNTSKDNFQLFRMIDHLASIRPTILLLNANLCWNESSWNGKLAPLPHCHWVKPIGRVKWIPDSAFSGKEDCAWYYFDKSSTMQHMFPMIVHPRDLGKRGKRNGL